MSNKKTTRGYRMNAGQAMTPVQRQRKYLKNLKPEKKRVQFVISSDAHSALREEADRLGLCMGKLIERLAAGIRNN